MMGSKVEKGLENFSTGSIPWNDVSITAASALCSIAMLIDLIRGIYYRKRWYPSKIFALNATTLKLLDIATKQPADLTTPMPTTEEQFTKLSGAALICIAMNHIMPSLGPMQGSDLIFSVFPLGILVLKVTGQVCIQMRTGVIHAFLPEHIITLCVMLIMLLITCSAAVTVPTMKQSLKQQYKLRWEQASSVGSHNREDLTISKHMVERFKVDLGKYWMMALSCNPHYVLSRSSLGACSDLLCILEVIVVIQAFIRTLYLHSVPNHKCSVMLIMFTQVFALVVGALASWFRSSSVVDISRVQMASLLPRVKTERYWIKVFEEWEDNPLPLALNIQRRRLRRWIHCFKSKILKTIRWLHILLVFFTKLLALMTVLLPTNLMRLFSAFMGRKIVGVLLDIQEPVATVAMDKPDAALLPSSKDDLEVGDLPDLKELRKFVLHLEGEDRKVDMILRFCNSKTEEWIQIGRKKSLTHLANLLKKSMSLESSVTVDLFHSRVSSAGSGSFFSDIGDYSDIEDYCWALSLVTLTSIAVAISYLKGTQTKSLLDEVGEGFEYARLVDEKLHLQELPNFRKAVDIIWLGIDLYQQWLDEDLAALASEAKDPMKIIRRLERRGIIIVSDFAKGTADLSGSKKDAREVPPRLLAAISMSHICNKILDWFENRHLDENQLFEWLHLLISDIMVACLTRLPEVLFSELQHSCIEAKDDSVREVACLLGEVERVVEVLGKKENEDLNINQCKFINCWRFLLKDLSNTNYIARQISILPWMLESGKHI